MAWLFWRAVLKLIEKLPFRFLSHDEHCWRGRHCRT
jgi:hypothetical protein